MTKKASSALHFQAQSSTSFTSPKKKQTHLAIFFSPSIATAFVNSVKEMLEEEATVVQPFGKRSFFQKALLFIMSGMHLAHKMSEGRGEEKKEERPFRILIPWPFLLGFCQS